MSKLFVFALAGIVEVKDIEEPIKSLAILLGRLRVNRGQMYAKLNAVMKSLNRLFK